MNQLLELKQILESQLEDLEDVANDSRGCGFVDEIEYGRALQIDDTIMKLDKMIKHKQGE